MAAGSRFPPLQRELGPLEHRTGYDPILLHKPPLIRMVPGSCPYSGNWNCSTTDQLRSPLNDHHVIAGRGAVLFAD